MRGSPARQEVAKVCYRDSQLIACQKATDLEGAGAEMIQASTTSIDRSELSISTLQRPIDFVALMVALLLTLIVALVVGWWYGLNWAVISLHPLFYVWMFAMAAGFPSYFLVRLARRLVRLVRRQVQMLGKRQAAPLTVARMMH